MYLRKLIFEICSTLVKFVLNQCKKIFSPITTQQLVKAVHNGGNLEKWLSLGANVNAKDKNGLTIFYNVVQEVIDTIAMISDLGWLNRNFSSIDVLMRYKVNVHLHDAGIKLLHNMPNFMVHIYKYDVDGSQVDHIFDLFASWRFLLIQAGVNINAIYEDSTAIFKHIMLDCYEPQRYLALARDRAALQLLNMGADVNIPCQEKDPRPQGGYNMLNSTALHAACKHPALSALLVTKLVDAGANVKARDEMQQMPFFYIQLREQIAPCLTAQEYFFLASLFLQKGAPIRDTEQLGEILVTQAALQFNRLSEVTTNYSLSGVSPKILTCLWGKTELTEKVAHNIYDLLESGLKPSPRL